jgi:serine/threonine-protein kinase HipA
MISVPIARAGERFILKVDPPEYPFAVDNEYFFLNLARASGIRTVDAQMVSDAGGRQGLLVRRFDRVAQPDGSSQSLACEDASQLLNRWPADKYNVTSEEVVAAVAAVCPASPVAIRDVFRQLCFAWLTGNGDVHAKNISVLAEPDGEYRVSPAYDLPSTVVYGDLTMALSLQGRTEGISRARLLDFAAAIGLASKAAQRVLDDLLESTKDLPGDLLGGALPFDQEKTREWVQRLTYRRRQLTA